MAIAVLQFEDQPDHNDPTRIGVQFRAVFDPPIEGENPTPAQAEALNVLGLYNAYLKKTHGTEVVFEGIGHGEQSLGPMAFDSPNDQSGPTQTGGEPDAG